MTINRSTLLDLPLPVTGTEAGTWGDVTNNGLTNYLDIAIAGMNSLTSSNFTAGALTISLTEGDASATNIAAGTAQYATIKVSSLAQASTITAPASARSYRIINADATYSLTIKASGQTGVTFLPGTTGLVAFNGTDYEIVGVVGPASATDNAVVRFDSTTGQVIQNSGVTIDDSNNVSGVAQLNATTADLTNIEVTNIKAKDGTAAGSIADSTGVVTLASSVLTTTDINGGTIDNTAIGGATPAAGAFTTLSASSTVTLSGGTANGVAYLNGSKVLTTGSALTFDTNVFTAKGSNGGYSLAFDSTTTPLILKTNDITGASYAPLAFSLGNGSGSYIEQMRLTSTGLGIGTSSPGATLDVRAASNPSIYVGLTSSTPDYRGYRLDFSTAQQTAGITFSASSPTAFLDLYAGGSATNLGGWSGAIRFFTGGTNQYGTERMRIDSSGNLGLGVTPSAWTLTGAKAIQVGPYGSLTSSTSGTASTDLGSNIYGGYSYLTSNPASFYRQNQGAHLWYTAPSGTAGNAISFTQAMTLTANSNLALGVTSELIDSGRRLSVVGGTVAGSFKVASTSDIVVEMWNAATSGNNIFSEFKTEASPTLRGSITYNRAGGLVAYNTTSDYRAKDIIGPVNDSGAVIDSTPVYMGKMKGATQERPMFIAHETPDYAHTGEKDAVDADGNPVYQQMDASALVPVLWAEIQSLRKRLAAAGI